MKKFTNKCPYYSIFKRKTYCSKYKTNIPKCNKCLLINNGKYPENIISINIDPKNIDILDNKGNIVS